MLTEHASQTMSVASAHPDKVLFVFAEAGDENIKLTLVNAAETAFPENAVLCRDPKEHLSQNNAERTALFDQVAPRMDGERVPFSVLKRYSKMRALSSVGKVLEYASMKYILSSLASPVTV